MNNRYAQAAAGCLVLIALTAAADAAAWQTIVDEHFAADPSPAWSYTGRQNAASQDLIRWDSVAGNLAAEWDQSNHYADWSGAGFLDPYQIVPSHYSRALGVTLSDADSFRFGARLRINSVANTTEFYQAACFGLYGLADMGPDRCMSDNFSGNTTIVKDGSDFVEFDYFIQNDSFGWNPMTQATIGAHIAGLDGDYTVGSGGDPLWHNTDMGAGHWLPAGTDLYVEVAYDAATRRANSTIYADPGLTEVLSVNGVGQYYSTAPLPVDKHFTLTDVAFWNYVGANWGGANGQGSGAFDDLYVTKLVPEPASAMVLIAGLLAACRARRRLA